LTQLERTGAELHHRLALARRDPAALTDKARSELIIELAPHLEDFIAEQFGIAREVASFSHAITR
jgi:hypothetical protein